MKFVSFSIAVCRHFSSQAAAFNTKSRSKNFSFFRKKKGGTGKGSKTLNKPKVKWTDEQEKVLDAACNGQSVFITGSAGTGKTFLLEHIIKELKKLHGRSRVYVTAPTGVAACALNGQTLHCFAGIGIGATDREALLERILMDKNACYRWRKVKALVIDEISMVDKSLFEGLAYVARKIRNKEENEGAWGGIQLVVSGDFFQLPPVQKKEKKGEKVYVFSADCWNSTFDIQIELTTIFRQTDALLIQLLQGIRKGESVPDDMKLLEGCCSGYEADPSSVQLYPRIADVEKVNTQKMEELGSEIHIYNAEDKGEEKWTRQLKSGIAPDELKICLGARVMLCKNINPWRKLVNGATGTVIGFVVPDKQYGLSGLCNHGNSLPLVKFDFGQEYVIEPETWVVMDGDEVVACRRQIPLILSWALSIHKCQGMTIEKLSTDLSRVFDYGMVYVALSRVKRLAGLHLSGLDPSKIKAHPDVLEFYQNFNGEQNNARNV